MLDRSCSLGNSRAEHQSLFIELSEKRVYTKNKLINQTGDS
jgi:hypothetical protein